MKLHLRICKHSLGILLKLKKKKKKIPQTPFINSIVTSCAKTVSLKAHFKINSTSYSRNGALCCFAVKQDKHISWLQRGVFSYLSRHLCLERPLCLEAITAPSICHFHLSNNVARNTQSAQGWLSDLSPAMSETQTRREKLSWMRNPFGAASFSI